ncbi:MAG: hypothetical protein ACJ0OB_00465 [Flavobacteriaceae bacterium]
MKNKIPINKKRFKTPKNYFNTLVNKIFEIKNSNYGVFNVPEGYFESINADKIISKSYRNNRSPIKLKFYRIASMAALIGLILYLNFDYKKSENDINPIDVINYIEQESFLLTNLEYSELFNSNDLKYYNLISERDIENYIIDSYDINLNNIIFE